MDENRKLFYLYILQHCMQQWVQADLRVEHRANTFNTTLCNKMIFIMRVIAQFAQTVADNCLELKDVKALTRTKL